MGFHASYLEIADLKSVKGDSTAGLFIIEVSDAVYALSGVALIAILTRDR